MKMELGSYQVSITAASTRESEPQVFRFFQSWEERVRFQSWEERVRCEGGRFLEKLYANLVTGAPIALIHLAKV